RVCLRWILSSVLIADLLIDLILTESSIYLLLNDKHKANRKKTEARLTGGGPPPPPLTPSEELVLSLNKGRPVVAGIPGGSSSHTPCTTS
ncbi:hypothetical protein QQF64_018721, partial [Cirrhinus molitorella]